MGYRTELEARLAKKTTRAIVDYQMIEEGDRVMVGLSGGKDSWALLQVLDVLRQRAPVHFSLVAVNVDSGYKEYKHDLIARTCTPCNRNRRSPRPVKSEPAPAVG